MVGMWQEPMRREASVAARAAQSVIDEFSDASHEVVAIGALREADIAGVPLWHRALRVSSPADCLWLATRAIRRATETIGLPRVVVCWNSSLEGLAQRAWPGATPVTTVDLCAGSATTRGGTAIAPTLSAVPLRADSLSVPPVCRQGARHALGIEPNETVIAMAGDADITPLTFVTDILRAAGMNVRGLVAAGAWGLRRARRHARDVSRGRVPCVVEGDLFGAQSACDLLLVANTSGCTRELRLALARAAGLPVVTGPDAGLEEFFHGRIRARVARSWAYSDLAAACLGLIEDDSLRRECAMRGVGVGDGVSLGTQLRAGWRMAGVDV